MSARDMTKDQIESQTPILSARGIHKSYGNVTAIDGADFDLYPGEILAVIGDNGAGKSRMIKVLSGATIPDRGTVSLDGEEVQFRTPHDAREAGIETVYQDLAVAPALDIATNLFLGREKRRAGPLGSVLRMIDHKGQKEEAEKQMKSLQIGIRSMSQAVETLSGGQRHGGAVARAAAGGRQLVIIDGATPPRGGGAQAGDHGRAHRRPRRARVRPGPRADQARPRQRTARDPDQPQHAARVRDRRSHPHPPSRSAGGGRGPEGVRDARGGGDHDGRGGPRRRARDGRRRRP